MIIDCHAHLTKRQLCGRGRKEQLLAEMRAAGVSATFLMGEAVANGTWFDTRELLEEVDGIPELKVIAGVDVDGDVGKQAEEYDTLIAAGKVVAFKLYPGYQYFYPADERLEPVYAVAKKRKVPVVIHTGDLYTEGAYQPPLLKYSHPLHVDEAAATHPDVTFVIAHLGSPWFADAAEVVFKNPNVYADVSGFFQGTTKSEHEEAYVALVKRRLADAIAYLGDASRFLFGTDWPLVTQEETVAFFRQAIPPKDQGLFFRGNAERLFLGHTGPMSSP